MTAPTLRPYQQQCIAGLRQSFARGHHSPLLVSPTGSGKTRMFAYLIARLAESGKRSAVLVHRDELVDQVSGALSDVDVRHGFVAAGRAYDKRLPAHVASVQTLVRRLDRAAAPDYVICDEAHHCIGASTWGRIVAEWRAVNPKLRLIGVTATPERLSGEGLGEVFDDMILGPTARELIDAGFLSPYRLFAPAQQLDLSGVSRRAGDFAKGELAAAVDKPAIIGDAVWHYRRTMNGAPAVVFCCSLAHAEHVVEQFRASGFRAAQVDGKMERGMRRALVQEFGRGALNVLVSVDVISEGFDVPGIVGAILLRPTQSLALYLQQVGRALRIAPGKDSAIILDHVGNTARHGMPDDEREWSLVGREESRRTKAGEAACRQCEKCFAVSPAAAAKCRECGEAFAVKPREIEQVDGTLSEVDVQAARRQAARDQAQAESLDALVELGRMRGYKNPRAWAEHVWSARARKRGVSA